MAKRIYDPSTDAWYRTDGTGAIPREKIWENKLTTDKHNYNITEHGKCGVCNMCKSITKMTKQK